MKAKIRSSVKTVQTREEGLAYVSREIIDFNYKLRDGRFQPIIEEVLFLEEEVDILDENNAPTGQTETVRTNIQVLRKYASQTFSNAQVDGLFNLMGQDIISSYSFTSKFANLLKTALLLDTQGFVKPLYGIQPSEWILDTDGD